MFTSGWFEWAFFHINLNAHWMNKNAVVLSTLRCISPPQLLFLLLPSFLSPFFPGSVHVIGLRMSVLFFFPPSWKPVLHRHELPWHWPSLVIIPAATLLSVLFLQMTFWYPGPISLLSVCVHMSVFVCVWMSWMLVYLEILIAKWYTFIVW